MGSRREHRAEKTLKLEDVGLFANLLAKAVDSADGGLHPFAKLDVELNGSNPIFVGIQELPPGSPSFRPHPPPVQRGQPGGAQAQEGQTPANERVPLQLATTVNEVWSTAR